MPAGEFRRTEVDGEPVGEFRYARSYLERADALPLDPIELGTLTDGPIGTARIDGVFGAFRDGCPDAWGRRVIGCVLGRTDVGVSEIDVMLSSPDDRAGALAFGRLGRVPPTRRLSDLEAVMEAADRIEFLEREAGQDPAPSVAALAATGLGGARPKVTVEDEGHLWVAKLPQPGDRWNNPRVEHATMRLARACGIDAAETRVAAAAGRDVLLVRRFDRHPAEGGYARSRMISGLTALGVDEDDRGRWSYLGLADAIRRIAGTDPGPQLAELFRRMTFNALISNTDDHPRNHAFLARGGRWTLSPAYDLTPTPAVGLSRRLAMACGLGGRDATRENVLSGCESFGLPRDEAEGVVDATTAVVHAGWRPAMAQAGVSEADAERVWSAFVCEGFGGRL